MSDLLTALVAGLVAAGATWLVQRRQFDEKRGEEVRAHAADVIMAAYRIWLSAKELDRVVRKLAADPNSVASPSGPMAARAEAIARKREARDDGAHATVVLGLLNADLEEPAKALLTASGTFAMAKKEEQTAARLAALTNFKAAVREAAPARRRW